MYWIVHQSIWLWMRQTQFPALMDCILQWEKQGEKKKPKVNKQETNCLPWSRMMSLIVVVKERALLKRDWMMRSVRQTNGLEKGTSGIRLVCLLSTWVSLQWPMGSCVNWPLPSKYTIHVPDIIHNTVTELWIRQRRLGSSALVFYWRKLEINEDVKKNVRKW